jgi:hypothetical protein
LEEKDRDLCGRMDFLWNISGGIFPVLLYAAVLKKSFTGRVSCILTIRIQDKKEQTEMKVISVCMRW